MLHPSAQVGQYKLYLAGHAHGLLRGRPPDPARTRARTSTTTSRRAATILFADAIPAAARRVPASSPATTSSGWRLTCADGSRRGRAYRFSPRSRRASIGRASKLMDHVADVIAGKPEYVLLDEQLVVFEKVLACARAGFHDRRKTVLLVKGGPGTGKSVIAINLMGRLLREQYNAHYATGSRAFTETLRERHRHSRGRSSSSTSTATTEAEPDAVDVLDLRRGASHPRDELQPLHAEGRSAPGRAQIDELLRRVEGGGLPPRRQAGRAPGRDRLGRVHPQGGASARCAALRVRARGAVPLRRLGRVRAAGSRTRSGSNGRRTCSGTRRTRSTSRICPSARGPRGRDPGEGAAGARARHDGRVLLAVVGAARRREPGAGRRSSVTRRGRGTRSRRPAARARHPAGRRSGRTTRAASTRSAASTRRRASSSTTSA